MKQFNFTEYLKNNRLLKESTEQTQNNISEKKIKSITRGLSPDKQEQLESYISSLAEIKKEIKKLVKQRKRQKNKSINDLDEIGGDMMHNYLDIK